MTEKTKKRPGALPIGPPRLDGTLGAKVKEARNRRGMTLAKLARLAAVSQSHLAELERGSNVSAVVLVRVAAALRLKTLPVGHELRLRMATMPAKPPLNREELEERLVIALKAIEECRSLLAESE